MDIKELRINNSLYYGDEIVKVKGIDVTQIMVWVTDNNSKPFPTLLDGLDPIPITEELLKELGFEEEKEPEEGWYYGIEKVFMKEFDSPIEEDYFVSLAQYEGGLYQLQVLGTIAYVRNLHELENFVYLTTKKELI